MKNIDEIINLVTKKNGKSNLHSANNSKSRKIDLLLSDLVQAKSNGRVRIKGATVSYRKTKSRLGELMLQKLASTNPEKMIANSYDRIYYKTLRNLSLANLLYLRYSKKSAGELLERNLRLAKKYHLTDVAVNSLRLLRYHAAYSGNQKKFILYDKALNRSLETLESEMLIEQWSQELILEVHHATTPIENKRATFLDIYNRMEKIASTQPTRANKINYYRFGVRLMEYRQEHSKVLSICKDALTYLKRNPHLIQKVRVGEFTLYKLGSCLQLNDVENGRKCATECDKLFQAGSDNWFIYLEWYFLLCVHTGDYQLALKILNQVTSHSRFGNQQHVQIEKWRILEAYLYFVSPEGMSRFNLYRFLNEVPLHSSDKSGFNLAILIAQIISLIGYGKYDEILEKSDALNIYCRRYIRIKDKYRTYYFMKMLQVMIKYSFEPKKTEQIARKFFEALSAEGKKGKVLEEIEVVPYETLWKAILVKLRDSPSA